MNAEADFEALIQQPLLQVMTLEGDLRAIGLPSEVSMQDACKTMDSLQSQGQVLRYKPLPAPAHGLLVLRPSTAGGAAARQ